MEKKEKETFFKKLKEEEIWFTFEASQKEAKRPNISPIVEFGTEHWADLDGLRNISCPKCQGKLGYQEYHEEPLAEATYGYAKTHSQKSYCMVVLCPYECGQKIMLKFY